VLGSTCLDSSGLEWLSSAATKLDTAAKQLAKRLVDLMLGSSQVTQSCVRRRKQKKARWSC
jgi:hypothetical protein